MHFSANIANVDVTVLCWDVNLIERAKQAGFYSVFGYNLTRSQRYKETRLDHPVFDYGEIIESHELLWKQCDGRALPFFPTVTMGCDCTTRWHPSTRFPIPQLDYPYEPIAVNNTPERYTELCRKAKAHMVYSKSSPKILFLNAWNEWPEGNYLLPEKQYGTAYLETVRDTFH
jgi:hypothetical protein